MKITNEKNFESILPDPDEFYALNAYKSGDSEYQPVLLTGGTHERP